MIAGDSGTATAPGTAPSTAPEPSPRPVRLAGAEPPRETPEARQKTARVTQSDIRRLSQAMQRNFAYSGRMTDRSMSVTLEVTLDPEGRILGGIRIVERSGRNAGAVASLVRSARGAIYKAAESGAFAALPRDAHDQWERVRARFTPGGVSL